MGRGGGAVGEGSTGYRLYSGWEWGRKRERQRQGTETDGLRQRQIQRQRLIQSKHIHLFLANLGGSACISEIVQAISAFRQFGGRNVDIGCTFTEFHADCP